MNRFRAIQSLLGLTDKEKSQILSINMSNHPGRFYKEGLDRFGRRSIGGVRHRSEPFGIPDLYHRE